MSPRSAAARLLDSRRPTGSAALVCEGIAAAAALAFLSLVAVSPASAQVKTVAPRPKSQTPSQPGKAAPPVTPPANPMPQQPTTPPSTSPVQPALPATIVATPPGQPPVIDVPPPVKKAVYLPFPNLPAVPLDEDNNGVGIAQQMTRQRGLQGRILWIDATANIERVNTAEKIATLVTRIKSVGFNTIVFDVKPIIGYTLYPSAYAPKLVDWVRPGRTQTLPPNFDPLKEMVAQTKLQGIGLIINLNAFSEGHREFMRGPGFDKPEWQTVLYDVQTRIKRDVSGTPSYPVMDRANFAPRSPDDLALYTDLTKLKPGANDLIALLDARGVVLAQLSGASMATVSPNLPTGGAALVAATPASANFLRLNASPGYKMLLDTSPIYIPAAQRPDRQIPLMVNPHSPEVRKRILDMLTEVATNYEVDGVTFDDRLRYAGLNADFSVETRRQFEQYIGKPVRWPDDVFRYEVVWPSLERHEVPGPLYDAWLTFRALNLRNWLAEAIRTIKTIRPQATVSTYVGSWYPDYPEFGANWAADDLQAGYRFLNESYRKTGWSGLVDFVMTGCYYPTATLSEAATKGLNIGESVEAAGQFSNRAVNDQTFVYAGIALDKFKGRGEDLKKVLQAAAATTQGIMVFDLSHDIEPMWAIFAEAFQRPAAAPHQVSGLVDELRTQKAARKASGVPDPPVILYRGASGTGF